MLSAYDIFGVSFALLNPEGLLLSCDDLYPNLLGHTHDSIQGMTAREVTHPEDRADYDRLMQRAAREGSGFIVRKRSLHRNGSIVWVQYRVTLFRGVAGAQLLVATRCIDPPSPAAAMSTSDEPRPCAGYIADLAGGLGRMGARAGLHVTAELLDAASRLAAPEADMVTAHRSALN